MFSITTVFYIKSLKNLKDIIGYSLQKYVDLYLRKQPFVIGFRDSDEHWYVSLLQYA